MKASTKVQGYTPAQTAKSRMTWCGPYATAALAGLDYDEAYKHCIATSRDPRHSSRSGIKGMQHLHVKRAVARAAPHLKEVWTEDFWAGCTRATDQPTFAQWLRTRDRKAAYLVLLTGHFVVVAGDRTIDSKGQEWTSVAKAKLRRKRVNYATKYELKGAAA